MHVEEAAQHREACLCALFGIENVRDLARVAREVVELDRLRKIIDDELESVAEHPRFLQPPFCDDRSREGRVRATQKPQQTLPEEVSRRRLTEHVEYGRTEIDEADWLVHPTRRQTRN